MPRPRRNSRSPSSRSCLSARKTVFRLTSSSAARSRAGGRRSPGCASPSAIARLISAATCSCRSVDSARSMLTRNMVLAIIALLMGTVTGPPPAPPDADLDPQALEALIEEARRRARRRRRGYAAAALAAVAAGLLGFYAVDNDRGGDGANRSSDRGEPRERGAGVTDGRWRVAPGLEGGTITAFAVDPRRPDTVFAATLEAGVFGSAHGGRTWQPLDLGPDVNRVDALAIAPGDPETIYAGTGRGVVKSTDGGASWQPAGLRGAPAINREPSSDEEVARFMEQSAHRAIEGYISTLVVD